MGLDDLLGVADTEVPAHIEPDHRVASAMDDIARIGGVDAPVGADEALVRGMNDYFNSIDEEIS